MLRVERRENIGIKEGKKGKREKGKRGKGEKGKRGKGEKGKRGKGERGKGGKGERGKGGKGERGKPHDLLGLNAELFPIGKENQEGVKI